MNHLRIKTVPGQADQMMAGTNTGADLLFRGNAFSGDVANSKINAAQQQHGLENVRSI